MGTVVIPGAIVTDTIATAQIVTGGTTAIEDGTAIAIARGTGDRADASSSGRSGSVREAKLGHDANCARNAAGRILRLALCFRQITRLFFECGHLLLQAAGRTVCPRCALQETALATLVK